MGISSRNINSRYLLEIIIVIFTGWIVAYAVILTSMMEAKWVKALMLGMLGLIGLFVIPDREKFMLYFSVFLLPINIKFHPTYYGSPFFREINGFQFRAIDIFLILLMSYWLIRLIQKKSKVRLHPWMTIPYMIIFIMCIVSWTGRLIQPAIKAGTLFLVIKNLFIFLYLANNITDRRTVLVLIGIILLSGSLQALIAIGQYLKGGPLGLGMLGEMDALYDSMAGTEILSRVGGTIGHPNKLALFLAFLVEINIAILFIPASGVMKILRVMSLFLMLPAIILTYSRSSWASLVLGGSISIYWCRAKKTHQKIMSAILVVIIIGGSALSAIGLIPSVRNRIFGDDRGSGDIRIPLKVIAKNIIRHNYWKGVGLNNYASVIHKYDNSDIGASWHFPMPVHNEYYLIAAELGIPAAITFIILLVFIFVLHFSIGLTNTDPVYPYLAIGFLCGWLGWCLHHRTLFEYVFFSHNIWFYLGIVQAVKNNLSK